MSKVTEKKEENYEELAEKVEEKTSEIPEELLKEKLEDKSEDNSEEMEEEKQETGTEVPQERGVSIKPSAYLGLGVVLLVVILFVVYKMFGKKKEVQTSTNTEKKEIVDSEPVSTSVKTSWANVHEQGAREDQQDSFAVSDIENEELVQKKGILLTVADGMGGLTNGGKISSLAVSTCQNMFQNLPEYLSVPDMLLEIAAQANRNVNQFLADKQRGGSTLVSAIIRENYLYFLTIGDSRIYLYRNGAFLQLNREHIYKEELAVMAVNGMLPVGRIGFDPQVKSLTSFLGNGRIAHLDRNIDGIKLIDKDKIILASDGVFGTLIPEQLEKALELPVEEAADKIREMVEEAKKPYQDNYTAVIFEYRK